MIWLIIFIIAIFLIIYIFSPSSPSEETISTCKFLNQLLVDLKDFSSNDLWYDRDKPDHIMIFPTNERREKVDRVKPNRIFISIMLYDDKFTINKVIQSYKESNRLINCFDLVNDDGIYRYQFSFLCDFKEGYGPVMKSVYKNIKESFPSAKINYDDGFITIDNI